jgi:hypothetical protein
MERVIAIFVVIVAMTALGFFAFRKGRGGCSCGRASQCKKDDCPGATRDNE